jgi:hypothetical protein
MAARRIGEILREIVARVEIQATRERAGLRSGQRAREPVANRRAVPSLGRPGNVMNAGDRHWIQSGAIWCMVLLMATTERPIRQSVSLPPRTARRVRTLARTRRTSASRVLVDLIESGLQAKEKEKRHYLELLERLRASQDPAEQERLTAELARLTFGE